MSNEQLAKVSDLRISFAQEDIMGRFKFYNGNYFSGTLTQVPKRTPEKIAERKRLSALLRDAKRKFRKKNQGKSVM